MGQPAARVGDMHVCPMFDGPKPHVGGPVLPPGKPTVLIGGMPAATITDRCLCASAPDVIVQGAATVFISGLMAARMGDMTAHGGAVILGCPTVLIGGPTFTVPSFFANFFNVFLDNLKFNVGVVVGFGEGLINTVSSLLDMLIHPVDTIKSIFKLADSVIDTLSKKETWIALTRKETWLKIKDGLSKIYDDYEKASPYEKGKVVGHATEFIAELLVPVAKAKLATEAAEAAKVAEATKAAAGLAEVAKPIQHGLTESELIRLERRKQALQFYKEHNPGVSPRELHSQVIGIDLDYPVEVIKIPPDGGGKNGGTLYQFVKEDAKGNIYPGEYYAVNKSSLPTELGVSPEYNVRAYDPETQRLEYTDVVKSVTQQEVEITQPVKGLKSRAKAIDDTWSKKPTPSGNPTRVPTTGGGDQVYIPKATQTVQANRATLNPYQNERH